MKGRQVIKTNCEWTRDSLLEFMEKNWDKENYCDFELRKPTAGSLAEYITLPATEHYQIIAYPNKNKVILSMCETPAGAKLNLAASIPTNGKVFASAAKYGVVKNLSKERKGPLEDILQIYTAHMKEILGDKVL